MLSTSLNKKTLQLLRAYNGLLTLSLIAQETGLTEGWLSMFRRGVIPNPSVNHIQTLYEYLSKTKLKI